MLLSQKKEASERKEEGEKEQEAEQVSVAEKGVEGDVQEAGRSGGEETTLEEAA